MGVVSIASTKGGVGKTTLARILSASLAAEGADFCAIDADPNEALSRWASKVYDGAPFEIAKEAQHDRLAHLIHARRQARETVIVDTAGFDNQAATIALTFADAVLIPIMSDEADMEGAERTWARCQGIALGARREIPAWIVLNGVKRQSAIHGHVLSELARLREGSGLRWLETKLSSLVAYSELSWTGALPARGPGYSEIAFLLEELRALAILPPPPPTGAAAPRAAAVQGGAGDEGAKGQAPSAGAKAPSAKRPAA